MRYVRAEEFACPCCGDNAIEQRLVNRLNVCRDDAGVPFVINSGFRCADHNGHVGGSATSSHLVGLAADIDAENSIDRYKILTALLKNGFTRLGVYPGWIHCDIDESKPQGVIWHG